MKVVERLGEELSLSFYEGLLMNLEQLLLKAEELGWSYRVGSEPEGTEGGWYHEERNYVELQKPSPAGEDFSMVIDFARGNPVDTFLSNLNEYWDNFDPDEHAEMWMPQRGKGGCPESILGLLTDAEEIKESVFALWSALAGKQWFGALHARLSSLSKEVEMLLSLAPSEEECCKEENQVFSDLANLKESLTSAGI